jgi:hypothetical protein
MLTDRLSNALEDASNAQPYVPDVGEALRRGRRRQARRRRLTVGTAVVAAAGIVTVVVVAVPGSSKSTATVAPSPAPPSSTAPAAPRTPADPALVQRVTTLPTSVFADVPARTDVGSVPVSVNGPALTESGKPVIFWYGAEYSPFSALERWPLIIALSRFGTWSSLSTVTSSSTDTPASIAGFTFYGARYSSRYVAFESVEAYTNQPAGDNYYTPLQSPTSQQQALVSRYDGANGSIPFIDFANQATVSGSTYDYSVLEGRSADEIAAALSDPSTDISQSIIGSANVITNEICRLTDNQPTSACPTGRVQVGTHPVIPG